MRQNKTNKIITVTGANGYIGKHVVSTLLDLGVNVIAVDRVCDNIDHRAKFIPLDVLNHDDDIYSRLGQPDTCLHLAWNDSFMHNSDTHMKQVSKHYQFLKNLIDSGLTHLAVMGSMHEIGYYEGCADEKVLCQPVNLYGIAKNSLLRSLSVLAHEKNIIVQWLRAFYITGDDRYNHSIFTRIIQAVERSESEFPLNSGKNKYDFIHIDDLARMITASIIQREVTGIINCCSGTPVSLSEKVEEFINNNKYNIKLKYGAYPDRPYDSPGIWGDNSKISDLMTRSEISYVNIHKPNLPG